MTNDYLFILACFCSAVFFSATVVIKTIDLARADEQKVEVRATQPIQ